MFISDEAIIKFNNFLDNNVSPIYNQQPMAQDWARISKVAEELGEAITEYISFTGQNPRKGPPRPIALERMLDEMADVAGTAILCIQHFTKNITTTQAYISGFENKLTNYMEEYNGRS